jgi:hypothetical protein
MPTQRRLHILAHDEPIFRNVIGALQEAEEIGGPEGQDYIDLMRAVSDEALRRLNAYTANRQTTTTGEG